MISAAATTFGRFKSGEAPQRENCQRDTDGTYRRSDDGDAGALRRRLAMRRAGIRPCTSA